MANADPGKRAVKVNSSPSQLRRAGLFKGLLFIGALALTAGLFFSTRHLIYEVRESSRDHLALSVQYFRFLLLSDNPELAYDAVKEIDFPIVLADENGNPKFWKNLEIDPGDTSSVAIENVRNMIVEMDKRGHTPVPIEVVPGVIDYFHYDDPEIVTLLRWFSVISVIAVALYILLGYIGFRTIRKAEERSVWVGMARETAHQLGTPISSLMGWIEVLGDREGEISDKMKQDIARLERIAVRFSKIGTRELLLPQAIKPIVDEAIQYMSQRVGSGIKINYTDENVGNAPVQADLISWVLENLVRNAAQAMEGEGIVKIVSGSSKDHVYIDVIDTGKGISPRDFETIFRPGFTTKKRGWGLGLSLGRRIVREMHRGRLFVVESKSGERTVIRMVLPN